jgi:hypothetical protein
MLFEDFAHDLFSLFVGDLLGLLKKEIGLLLVGDVKLMGEGVAKFPSEKLGEGGTVREIRDNEEGELTSGSPEPPFSTDSLLEFFSLEDMLCFVTWGAPSGYSGAG